METGEWVDTARTTLQWLLVYVQCALKILYLRIVLPLPVVGGRLADKLHHATQMDQTNITKEEWIPTVTTWAAYIAMVRDRHRDVLKKVTLNGKYPDADLHRLDGALCRISDFLHGGRPLVLNFGSNT